MQNDVSSGVGISVSVRENLDDIENSFSTLSSLISGVADASAEQSREIEQIYASVEEMEKVINKMTGNTNETLAESSSLFQQSKRLNDMVSTLTGVVGKHGEKSGMLKNLVSFFAGIGPKIFSIKKKEINR